LNPATKLSPADYNLLKSTDANMVINVTFLMKVSPKGIILYAYHRVHLGAECASPCP
jgi:hypothetical protein